MTYNYNERNRRRREQFRKVVLEAKDRPCADCGIKYPPFVMDFDHVTGSKKFNISVATNSASSLKSLLAEIDKCEVVCSNCHRFRTFRD